MIKSSIIQDNRAFSIMQILLIFSYIIYVPVSIFQNLYYLLILDIILISVIANINFNLKSSGNKNPFIYFFIICSFLSVFTAFIFEIENVNEGSIQGIRSLLFGLFVFTASKRIFTNFERIDKFLRLILVLSFISIFWGLRQIIFGLFPFELNRLGLMGSSLIEFEIFNRLRIPSTFGDGASFSYYMMIAVFVYQIARKRNVLPFITNKLHPWSFILILLGLVFSLNRAPFLGVLVGSVIYFIFHKRQDSRKVFRNTVYFVIIIFIVFALNQLQKTFDTKFLGFYGIQLFRGFESIWSVFAQLGLYQEIDDTNVLLNVSRNARELGIIELFKNYLTLFGLGIGQIAKGTFKLNFSPVDTGFFIYLLYVGMFGFFSFIGVYLMILIKSIQNVLLNRKNYFSDFMLLFMSLWIAILVANSFTSYIFTEIVSLITFCVAGIIVNIGSISLQERAI